MRLENLMSQLEKELELEAGILKTKNYRVYTFPIDEESNIEIRPTPQEGILFHCTLANCPQGNEEGFYRELLSANFFGIGTKGAILGLSEDGNQLTLSRLIEYNVEYKEFSDILEDFLNVADFWRQETLNYK